MDLFELYVYEDCPYIDETTELLEISGTARIKIISRERGISACTEDLSEFYSKKGLKVLSYIKSGEEFNRNSIVFEAEGDASKVFMLWRVSQTFLSITCAIATYTRRLVEKARKVNPNVVIATTRKTHPGMRKFEIKAIFSGGGVLHRNSLSDSILITTNHLRTCKKDLLEVLKNIKGKTLRKIEVEPEKFEDALKAVDYADVILFDHYNPEELKKAIKAIREKNKKVEIAVAGNINLENVSEYAIADVIVTSSPYYAKPLDLTSKIEKV